MRLQHVERFAAANHGLVSLDAALAAGVSRRTYFRAVADGELEPVHPCVARIRGTPVTKIQSIAAAVLAAGPGALASHRSAAFAWGISRPDDDPIDIILTARSREARLDGVVIHRPRDHRDLRPVRRQGIAVCNPVRWACDLGVVDPDGLEPAVRHLIERRIVTVGALGSAIANHARRGRPGVPALRAVLDHWLVDGKLLDSELEQRMLRLIRKHGLPAVEFHAMIDGHEVDFWVVGTPIVLECDGFEFHGARRPAFERDRWRDIELTAAGYITVRFTYSMLTRQPQWVATRITQAVERWRHAGRPSPPDPGGMRATPRH